MNDNKVALITGGSRGIGEKIAERFAQAGYNLIINYVSNIENVEELEAKIKGNANIEILFIQSDVTSFESCENMVNEAIKKFGPVSYTHLDVYKRQPIKAAASGKVIWSGYKGSYGNLVKIDSGKGVVAYYGHCSKLYVSAGEQVKAGDVIATVGSTGNSTGNHLHFEIQLNGQCVNPQKYLYK